MKYSLAYTIAFEVDANHEGGEDLTGADLRRAIIQKLECLSDEDVVAACDAPFDAYEYC